MQRFMAHWPLGTMQRLAFDLFRFTGLRRGDVVKLGRQHIREGAFHIRTSKTGQVVELAVHAALAESIMATRCGKTTFLVTGRGVPFAVAGFGNWFRDACRAARVPGSAHGIRKHLASEAAEKGASEEWLNAFFGWAEGSRESATYTKKARRKAMAAGVAEMLFGPNPPERLGRKSPKSLK